MLCGKGLGGSAVPPSTKLAQASEQLIEVVAALPLASPQGTQKARRWKFEIFSFTPALLPLLGSHWGNSVCQPLHLRILLLMVQVLSPDKPEEQDNPDHPDGLDNPGI